MYKVFLKVPAWISKGENISQKMEGQATNEELAGL